MTERQLTARRSPSLIGLAASLVFAGLAAWAVHHVVAALAALNGMHQTPLTWVFAFTFGLLVWQVGLAHVEKVYGGSHNHGNRVVVAVPVYNEDAALLRDSLASMLEQTRRPHEIYVVDDGSTSGDYSDVREWFLQAAEATGVRATWVRVPNGGKRHAQAVAVRATPEASIYVTVDSDTVLDPKALAEALKPFRDPRVQSVAGVVLAHNNRTNLLARLTDLWFVSGQLVDRSSMSALGSVLVNSGGLALYRADVVRDNLPGYLSETFLGAPVPFSDDSLLTLYALQRGRTVQQPTAFAFTMMPERLSHHFRQQVRWMRGSFIRSWWRARYLPMTGYAYWIHAARWLQFAVSAVVFLLLFVYQPIVVAPSVLPSLLVVPLLIGYAQSLRYLAIRRSDQTLPSQLLTVALSPLTTLWAFFVLRPLRWYAIATCLRTGWGTRASVEVALAPSPAFEFAGNVTADVPLDERPRLPVPRSEPEPAVVAG